MRYVIASKKELSQITEIVQQTIKQVYPKYYPKEVVDFFLSHHCMERIKEDIEKQCVGVLLVDGKIVGTGSYQKNNITRVYVLPEFQGKGYGSYIIKELERIISKNYTYAMLDASLPACTVYEHMGYQTVGHGRHKCENDVVLVYEKMKMELSKAETIFNYNGKCFVPKINSSNGEVDGQTVFFYYQKDEVMWAEYAGGEIIKGMMVGTVAENGELEFYYQHINQNQERKIGTCHSKPMLNEEGKIELHEEWQWLNGDCSKGTSVVVETTLPLKK